MKYELSQRGCAMEEIMAMDKDNFLWKLMCNSLPEFVPATEGDEDYLYIHRDSNRFGSDYVYVHRSRLRQTDVYSYRDYLYHEEMDQKMRNRKIRSLSMHLIYKKTEDEFKDAVLKRELPDFPRAIIGDKDYFEWNPREIKIDELLKNVHREYLRVMDLDTYLQYIWTPLVELRLV